MVCDELGRETLSCKLVTIVDQDGKKMTPDELRILQAGFNLINNAKNICMSLFSTTSHLIAILETWIKLAENLALFQDPSPSTQAKGMAQALLKKNIGDGNVYSVVLMKAVRSELAYATTETCKTWMRQAV